MHIPSIIKKLLVASLILLGFLGRSYVVLLPTEQLVTNIPDDAYYYFQVARNIAAGNNVTFDGTHLTNGFHPLWMLLITPLFSFFNEPESALRASLFLSILLDAGACALLYIIIKQITNRSLATILALLPWIQPFHLLQSINGLETSLTNLCLLALLYLVYRYSETNTPPTIRPWMLGVSAGLLVLARLDAGIYALIPLIIFVIQKAPWKNYATYILSASIVTAPWFVWNLITFGTPIQTSGVAFTYVRHTIILQSYGYEGIKKLLLFIKAGTGYFLRTLEVIQGQTGYFSVLLIVGACLLGVIYQYARSTNTAIFDKRIHKILFLSLAGGGAIYIFIHGFIRWADRNWYFDHLLFTALLALACLLSTKHILANTRWVNPLIAALFMAMLIGYPKQLNSIPSQAQIYHLTLQANTCLPEQSVLGAFNAGIAGFYSSHTLVNLDGLINTSAFEAIKNRRMADYLKSEGITHLLDGKRIIEGKYNWTWGKPVQDIAQPSTTCEAQKESLVLLYDVRR